MSDQNPFARMARFAKQSADPVVGEAELAQINRQQTLKDIGAMLAIGSGIGLTGRSLMGLFNLARRTTPTNPSMATALASIPYPVRRVSKEEEESKTAVDKDYTSNPMYYPAMMTAGLGSIYGSWTLLDHILDKRRKAEKKEELENARNTFEKALLRGARVREPFDVRTAEDHEAVQLSEHLDKVAEQLEKVGYPEWLKKMLGSWLGFYAVPSAALTGILAYNRAKKMRQSEVLEEAMRQRDMTNYNSRPTEILMVPSPVTVRDPVARPDKVIAPRLKQELSEDREREQAEPEAF